jgi:hypothetical protein
MVDKAENRISNGKLIGTFQPYRSKLISALDLRSLATEGTQEISGFKKVGKFS